MVGSHFRSAGRRTASSYRDQIHSLVGLPTLPMIATEILQITRQDRLSVRQMVPIIDKDPSLAMKLLKMANSAYYGLEEKVESLRQAIVVIGMKELANLAVGFSVLKAFVRGGDAQHMDWKRFWEHSAASGHIAEILNGELKTLISSSPYSLGLLHDIGKLVLYRIDPELYVVSLKIIQDRQCSSPVAEMEAFGITHMEAGKWIAEKWQLSEATRCAIGYHHHPSQTPDPSFEDSTALIQLADLASNLKGVTFGTPTISSLPQELDGWVVLQTDYEHLAGLDLESLIFSLFDQIEVIKDMVSLIET